MIFKRIILVVFLVVAMFTVNRTTIPNDSSEQLEQLEHDLEVINGIISWVDDISIQKDMKRRKWRKEIAIERLK